MLKKLLYGFVALTAIGTIYGISVQPPHVATVQAPVEQPDPQRMAVAAGAVQLKRMAHDPESFELVQALLMDDGAGCYTYRAKNGFGAVRTAYAVMGSGSIFTSESDRFQPLWNKHCQGRKGTPLK